MGSLTEIIAPIGILWIIGWIFRNWFAHRRVLKLAAMQADLQARMLDKFGTAPEMVQYLQSDSGQNLLQAAPVEKAHPYHRILGSVQAGIILALVGIASLFLRSQIADSYEAFVFLGSIGLALGVGFLISSAIAFFLSKHWGLINGHTEGEG